ncbi:GDSL-type esterase/lipase family protein [Streptomyces sp. NPDC059701]|uniref:GDSL-type esterase/lipase family protein n=1 Tax=Streptomyces sp. NPDC059701 TaxID=3346914 RepID=UPI0036B35828
MKICVIGNSVAASRTEEEAPLAGWGQYLEEFLGAGSDVRNYARDAMTLRGYYTERFAALLTLVGPGDVVLIAFGHVEQRINQLNRYHGPREFKEYLRLYVEALRAQGALPVLVAPAARCVFDASGRPVDTHDGYRELTLEAAAELDCPVIDLTASTTQLLAELGPTRARNLYRWLDPGEHPGHPQGIIDSSHFNHAGAREAARLVASGLAGVPGVPPGLVQVQKLMPGPMPEVRTEFTVQHPHLALTARPEVSAAPVVRSPEPGRPVGAGRKLTGTAPAGAQYVMFFEDGQYLGGTQVAADGTWQWRRAVQWPAGRHKVTAVALAGSAVSSSAEADFEVLERLDAPEVVGPRPGAWSGPRPRFSGTAGRGTEKVMVLEQGRLIAEAPVQEDGTWRVTHAHDWRPGTYTVEFVAVFSAIRSAPARLELKVHGVPEDSWLHTSMSARVACGPGCEHYPALPAW